MSLIATPSFWYEQKTWQDKALKYAFLPLSWAYGALARKNFDLYHPVPMEKPVICVGNVVAGGAGKTPVVLSIADMLKEKGYNPHLLSRGYGGNESGPMQVSPGRDTAFDVGDEALLLVEKAPTWIAAKRALGAQAAMESGADIVVMDDGFQNAVIYKDFSITVIDGAVGFGNRCIMPAGPLREPLRFALSRADAFVIIGEDRTGAADIIRRHARKSDAETPILYAALVPDAANPDVAGRAVFAFAGIGRPEKFKETLEAAGAHVEGWAAFPDHYPYEEEDLYEILAAAEARGLPLLTTEKDWVRVPAALRQKIGKFSVHLEWQDPDALFPLIELALRKRSL
jgi:tetraacyldisaccharide 4'-kinase